LSIVKESIRSLLQYWKLMRLNETRRLLLKAGYVAPTRFQIVRGSAINGAD